MHQKINILSTKTLSKDLISILPVNNFNTLSLDFIQTNRIPFDEKEILNSSNHWIISSKNTLNILFDTYSLEDLKHIFFYCVGDKTSNIITHNNLKLITSAQSSSDLAKDIVENYNQTVFTFIGGEMRRKELTRILKSQTIELSKYNVYSTNLFPCKIESKQNGILFFSPSAVQSFVLKNTITTEQLFCIGNTTANEAKQYSTNINIAQNQTIESVIELVKTYYK